MAALEAENTAERVAYQQQMRAMEERYERDGHKAQAARVEALRARHEADVRAVSQQRVAPWSSVALLNDERLRPAETAQCGGAAAAQGARGRPRAGQPSRREEAQ